MQKTIWYLKRIQRMSGKEVIWRLTILGKALLEHARVKTKQLPQAKFIANYQADAKFTPAFHVFDIKKKQYQESWRSKLINKADLIISHQLSYFNLQNQHLETPINWHKDHSTGQLSSRAAIISVNYRDIAVNGDCKLVWEPNRHHQLVVLGRAYQITKDLKYAQAVVNQLNSWLDANPYGYGMNWCNPLELGIRLINWVWTIDLILDSGLFTGKFKADLLQTVFLHCRDVYGKFSQGSSANNHLVGEAAGVYTASSYFSIFSESQKWAVKSKQILEEQIQAQTFTDGCSREHGFSYQFFVFQLYLFASQTGKLNHDLFTDAFYLTLEKIAVFIATVAQGGNKYPMFGDQDDGYALDLGDNIHDINALCDLASQLYENPVLHNSVRQQSESVFWLFQHHKKTKESLNKEAEEQLLSQCFNESNYFLLQAGTRSGKNQVSLLFDCAKLGYTAIAAHGHADALSFVMRLNGNDLFIDSGTYDYYSFPEWRNHFRKTRAHNTIEIDGLDQSVISGPFMWEQHAQASCLLWNPSAIGGRVIGLHNGYLRLKSPVIHQRCLLLNSQTKQLKIVDSLETQGNHEIIIYFHLSEYCTNITIENNTCRLTLGEQGIIIELPDKLQISSITGIENKDLPSVGWISRGYHQKTAITTLIAKGKINGNSQFETLVYWS